MALRKKKGFLIIKNIYVQIREEPFAITWEMGEDEMHKKIKEKKLLPSTWERMKKYK